MEKTNNLKGIYAPVVSPCDDHDRLLSDVFAKNIERLYSKGINGLYVCGATGDAFSLKMEERKEMIRIACEISADRGRYVIAHVGAAHIRDSAEMAAFAADSGAAAVASIPPVNMSTSHLVEYYTEVARASGIPVFVYHIPVLTHSHPTVEDMLRLLDIEGVAGLKLTDWNLFFMKQLKAERPDIIVYNGYDELMALGLIYGADGCIGTWVNMFPDMYVKVYKYVSEGDLTKAMLVQNAFADFLTLGWRHGIGDVFEYLMRREGHAAKCFRKPSDRMDEEVGSRIYPELKKKMDVMEGLI